MELQLSTLKLEYIWHQVFICLMFWELLQKAGSFLNKVFDKFGNVNKIFLGFGKFCFVIWAHYMLVRLGLRLGCHVSYRVVNNYPCCAA